MKENVTKEVLNAFVSFMLSSFYFLLELTFY